MMSAALDRKAPAPQAGVDQAGGIREPAVFQGVLDYLVRHGPGGVEGPVLQGDFPLWAVTGAGAVPCCQGSCLVDLLEAHLEVHLSPFQEELGQAGRGPGFQCLENGGSVAPGPYAVLGAPCGDDGGAAALRPEPAEELPDGRVWPVQLWRGLDPGVPPVLGNHRRSQGLGALATIFTSGS